jgi:hypothetical protein
MQAGYFGVTLFESGMAPRTGQNWAPLAEGLLSDKSGRSE